jgi:filamentous hemagglutinin family protein
MQSKTLLSLLAVTGAFLQAEMASAQALPPSVRTPQADKTLGTQVSGTNNNFTVTGGLNRGQTLFHSFKDFSIPTGGAANFNNPAGTRDIITRVTGNLFSDINGTLNSNGANFLLINPNGVVFGPNARLNVGKAFAASTASGVDLIDGQGRQITFGTKPGGDAPLLKINPNVFLNISRLNMGASVPKNPGIVNYGKLQTNNDSQYIGLIGGNVTLDGKYGGGKIIAPGGRVDLGGLNSAGTISTDAQGLVFGGNGLTLGDVLLTNDASVSARANQTLGTVNPFFSNLAVAGSNININANNLNVLNSGAKSNTGFAAIDNGLEQNSGVKTQPAGNINVNATGLVNLDNANIKNTLRPGAEGKIGDININANSLSLINKSIISSRTSGKGNAGDININANSLSLINNSDISTINLFGNGDAGDININANSLSLINSSDISTSNTLGKGNAGNINVKTTGDISIVGTTPQSTEVTTLKSNDSSISSDTNGQGNTGKITIDTRGKLLLLNGGNIASRIGPTGVGKGNDIKILAQAIDLTNGSSIITDNISKVDVKGNENKKIAQELGFTDFLSKIGADNVGGKGDAGNIDIKTTGDIRISSSNPQLDLDRKMTAKSILSSPLSSSISSSTNGQGNAGGITIDTQNRGKLSLFGGADISSVIGPQAVGKGNGIKISAQAVDLIDGGTISTSNAGGKGDAGNIRIDTIGDISLLSSLPRSTNIKYFSAINTDTFGQGNAGKITIDTQNRGKLSLSNGARISSGIVRNAVGNGGGIAISAREIDLQNQSSISTSNGGGKGDAGSIDLKTTGDINIFGSIPGSTGLMTQNSNLSFISSNTSGQGKAGKITIDTQDRGKLLLDQGFIFSTIDKKAVGNGGDVTISAREIDLRNRSFISSSNFGGKGDAGNIDIKTIGNVSLFDANITSSTTGQGKAGNITIDTQDRGKLSLDRADIASTIEGQKAVGNGGKIAISAREIDLRNGSGIDSSNLGGKGDAGNIDIKTIGDISISGSTPESTAPITPTSNRSRISSFTIGQGNAGKITIDTQNRGKLSLSNRSFITNEISKLAVGNSPGISISARELDLHNQSFINSTNFGGIGDAGNIKIDTTGAVEITNASAISSTNFGQGKTGDISLASDRITLNDGNIESQSRGATGGNIQLTTKDRLLLRNLGNIAANSGSTEKNGNGGNITINSPLIIALPGDNNIAADAVGGNGGRVNITSQGLFGIKYRPKGQDSLFTSDITSSSTFGQSGTVNISTPGTDPGKDSTVLPTVPTDASNQIAQTCGASRENKFIVAGRGGIPANANDPLTSDVVWQDTRGTNNQPTASNATTDPTKLAPPATGLVFDGKGKATLIAAGTEGQPTRTSVVCPNVVKK